MLTRAMNRQQRNGYTKLVQKWAPPHLHTSTLAVVLPKYSVLQVTFPIACTETMPSWPTSWSLNPTKQDLDARRTHSQRSGSCSHSLEFLLSGWHSYPTCTNTSVGREHLKSLHYSHQNAVLKIYCILEKVTMVSLERCRCKLCFTRNKRGCKFVRVLWWRSYYPA